MRATIATVLGAALVVAAVYGLAGLWWASAVAGLLFLAYAYLDERGRDTETPEAKQ